MNREELVKKLGLASLALAKNDQIPILKCFAFTGKEVVACNSTVAITSTCLTDIEFCVHGDTLKGLLENSHSENVEFDLKEDDLIVKAGKSTFKLPWFPIDDYLWQIPEEKRSKFDLDAALVDGLTACLLTAGDDQSQPALMGVQFTDGTMYSTDGDAVTKYNTVTKIKAECMLPSSFCDALIKVVMASDPTGGVFSIGKEWAWADLGSQYSVYGNLMVIDTPIDHEGLIKKTLKNNPQFTTVPEGLGHALSRARVVADAESAKTVFTVEKGRLKLLTTAAMGVINDTLPFAGHSDVQANVSAARIQRCISLCDEMSVSENCCTFRSGSKLFILAGNLGG